MISIFSGLAGAILASRWSEANETSVLTTRGKAAIRGLNLLLVNLTSSEARTCKYLAEMVEKCSDVQRAKNALADAQQASTEEKQELENRLRKSQQELAMASEQL